MANATPTFRAAAERIILQARRDGMRTANARLARLEKHVFPALGTLSITNIVPSDISAVLANAARGGLAAESLRQLGVDMRTVFNELVRDDLLEKNPARVEKIRMPKARRDTRKRVLLTDPEFLALVAAPTPRQLAAMAVCSRCFGGLRPSDIYAWQWSDIDLEGGTAAAPRPKTEHHGAGARERIVLPSIVVDTLRAWGPQADGAVFPRPFPMLARSLRTALLAAGVTRHELHHDTAQTRRVDFYSFRRAFVTAVAASGASATVGMRLAGHTNMTTHQRYHVPAALVIPAAAVPTADPFEAALAAFVA